MGVRTRYDEEGPRRASGGVGGFLRSLLAGVPWSETARREERLEFDAPTARELRIRNPNGQTRIIGEDRDTISVDAEKKARAESFEAAERLLNEIKIVSNEREGRLELDVDIPRKWNRHGNANLEVRVPRGTQVSVIARNGKICAEGLRGRLHARSSNGAVRIVDVVGDIDVETSNAKVSCQCTCGRLMARSSNGKIELNDHKGSIDATTSNGLIHASLEEIGDEGVQLSTSNGRIILDLPDDADAEIDIRVDNGVIRNHRTLQMKGREQVGRLRGRLGCGGIPIRLRTSNGTISLREVRLSEWMVALVGLVQLVAFVQLTRRQALPSARSPRSVQRRSRNPPRCRRRSRPTPGRAPCERRPSRGRRARCPPAASARRS